LVLDWATAQIDVGKVQLEAREENFTQLAGRIRPKDRAAADVQL
jgi:hypothetical protein